VEWSTQGSLRSRLGYAMPSLRDCCMGGHSGLGWLGWGWGVDCVAVASRDAPQGLTRPRDYAPPTWPYAPQRPYAHVRVSPNGRVCPVVGHNTATPRMKDRGCVHQTPTYRPSPREPMSSRRLRRHSRQGCRRSITVVSLTCAVVRDRGGWDWGGDCVAIASGPLALHSLALHWGGFSLLARLFGIGVVGIGVWA